MVHVFRSMEPSEPWLFTAIGIALFIIIAVHIYRVKRRKLARRRHRSPPAGKRPFILGTLVDKCGYDVEGSCRQGIEVRGACPYHGQAIQLRCPQYAPF